MSLDHPVLSSLLPVVLLILMGFVAGKAQWVRSESVRDLSNLVFLVLTQALLFRTMSSVHLEQLDFTPVVPYFGVAGGLFGLMLLLYGGNSRASVLALASIFSNTLMIGVPLIGLAVGVRPGWMVFFAAAVACAGVGLVSFDVQGDFWADLATLAAALAYALYTILMSSHAKNHRPAQLATAQIACMALLGALWMLVDSGAPRVLSLPGLVEAEVWWGLLFLGAVASAATFFLQAMAQSHVSAPQAAIIYAMEPVFAAAFGWWYISEQMTPMALLGGALVIAAVILSQRAQPPTP